MKNNIGRKINEEPQTGKPHVRFESSEVEPAVTQWRGVSRCRKSLDLRKLQDVALWSVVVVAFWAQSISAAPILLKSGTINPEAATAVATSQTKTTANAQMAVTIPERGLYLVQCPEMVSAEWYNALKETGAKIRSYIPENAYLVDATTDAYRKIAANVPHSYLGEFRPEYRIDESVLQDSAAASTTAAEPKSQTTGDSTDAAEAKTYDILLFEAADLETVSERISKLGGCEVLPSVGAVIRAKLTADAVLEIASWVEVHWIEPYVEPTINNNVAVQSPRMNVQTVWPNGASNLGLTGARQVVAVADTGLDTGNLSTVHEDVRERIIKAYALAPYGYTRYGDWSDPAGHGTHVVGSVLGNGAKSGGAIKGTAYEAKLIFQSAYSNANSTVGWLPTDKSELFLQTYTNQNGNAGARIHSDSWGAPQAGRYTSNSASVDSFMFSHPDFLAVFSAGNDGVDANEDGIVDSTSIGSPGTAKNCITVGNAENQHAAEARLTTKNGDWGKYVNGVFVTPFPAEPIYSDYVTRDPNGGTIQGIAASSSRGPCIDNRIKPDIVAPGQDVLSLLSSKAQSPDEYHSYDSFYCYKHGTSMAAPLVSGSAALVRQWLQDYKNIQNPDGATIKAVLLAGAKSLSPGQYGTDPHREIPASYPNNVEGWGQANVGNAVANANGVVVHDAQIIANGEIQTFTFTAQAGSALSIVMAYTDAPGSPSSSQALVNNLDLLVTTPSGATLYPNSRTSSPDSVNNVEGVRIASAEAGVYTATVKATKITTGMEANLVGGRSLATRYSLVANGAESGGTPAVVLPTIPAAPVPYVDGTTLRWNAVAGANYYKVYRATNPYSEPEPYSEWIYSQTHSIELPSAHVVYYYWVKAAVAPSDIAAGSFSTAVALPYDSNYMIYTSNADDTTSHTVPGNGNVGVASDSRLRCTPKNAESGLSVKLYYGTPSISPENNPDGYKELAKSEYANVGGGIYMSKAGTRQGEIVWSWSSPNTSTSPRMGGFNSTVYGTVYGWWTRDHFFYQAGKTDLSIGTTSQPVPADGGTYSVSVTATPSTTSWSASVNKDWVRLYRTSSNGSGVLGYYVEPNEGAARTATITVAGKTLSVSQAACASAVVRPSNDNYESAAPISGASDNATGSNVNATREVNEPYVYNQQGTNTVWWAWTAPATGVAVFDTKGSGFDTVMAAYAKASSVSSLGDKLDSNDDDDSQGGFYWQSKITFDTAFSSQYRIVVAGYGANSGSVKLNWQQYVKVSFNGNGATSGSMSVQTNKYNTATALPSCGFSRSDGYVFDGWSTSAGGSVVYTPDDSPKFTSNTTLYAHWAPSSQTVTFNANGGTSCTNREYTVGSTYGSLPTTSKTGYTFAGWWTSSSGGTQITASSTVSSSTMRTLYAHWTPITYNINYSLGDGGTHGATHPSSKSYDEVFYVSAPTRSGYTFTGWTVTSGLNTSTAKWGTTSSPSTSLTSTSTKCVNGATGNVYFKNLRASSGSVTLTANWTCNHASTSIQNALAATCTTAGYTGDRVCSTCGAVVETGTTIPALRHQEGAGVVTQAPTLTAEGVMTYSCTRCGFVMRTEAIPKLVMQYPDLGFATFSDWDFVYVMFTTTNAVGAEVFNSAPARLFDCGELFKVVYGYGNFSEVAISNATVVTRIELISETDETASVTSSQNAWTLDPYRGGRIAKWDLSWTNLAAGVYTAHVTLDAENAIADTNRANNVRKFVFAIRDPLALGDALGCVGLDFGTNADDWYGTRDGADPTVAYARTRHLGNYGTNVLSATVTGAGTLTFDWKVSSEKNNDWLEFLVDGVVTNRISGTNCVWQGQSYDIAEGGHVVEWRYRKDDSYYAGLDCSWLANVKWTPLHIYTVSFDPNGGTGTMEAQTFQEGESQSLRVNTFTKSGFHFIGWAENPDATVAMWMDGESVAPTESITLYAVWRSNKHAVEFHANGGTGTMKAQTFTWNVEKALSACSFTRAHYAFAGWATNENGSVVYVDQQSIQIDEDMDLWAVWSPETYSVTFNGNGETDGTMEAQSFTYGVSESLSANAFHKTGHDFKGWATTQGGAVVYADGAQFSATANITLWAVWEAKTYTVTFNGNGATSGAMASQSFTYGVAMNLNANAFQKTGHDFKGWAAAPGGVVVYADGAQFSATANVTLWAVWEPKTFMVTFNGNGATGGAMAAQSFTYGVAKDLSANAFQKTGHDFMGWATTQGGAVVYADGAQFSATASITLWAVWEAKTYNVTFNGNGATSGAMASQSFTYGVAMNLNANAFQKTGHDFKGWAAAPGGTVVYADGASFSATADVTLWAVWEPKMFTIRFLMNDGTATVLGSQQFTYGVSAPLDAPMPTRDGYTLAGWAESPNGGVAYVGGETVTFEDDTDLYAVWSAGLGAALAGTESLVWRTGGDAPWTGVAIDGEDVAQSGVISDDGFTYVATDVTGPGRLTFRWKVSSESYRDYQIDYLSFSVDDEEMDWIGGEVGWTECTFDLNEGPHTLTWTYFKDEVDFDGEDCAWLDSVFFLHSSGVSFAAPDATSGSVPSAIEGWENDEVMLPAAGDLRRAKHEFAGWTDGIATYSPGGTYILPSAAATLSAVWTAKVVATPVIDTPANYTAETSEASITCATPGATIRYTLDGSDPLGTNGVAYNGPFAVAGCPMILAAATLDDWFDSAVATASVSRVWTAAEVLNAPDRFFDLRSDVPWTRDLTVSHDGTASMRSGAIGDGESTSFSTVVYGSGTVSFWWRVSSEIFKGRKIDYLSFMIDGTEAAWIGGEKDWAQCSAQVSGDGTHTLSWVYSKDSEGSAGDDACWVDEFVWTPDGSACVMVDTGDGEKVAVERAWIEEKFPGVDASTAAAGLAANGKPVWQAYVVGYDPTDPNADFRATIRIVNGIPVVDPDPNLGETRTYVIEGKPMLDDIWGEPDGDSRFFRIRVLPPDVSNTGGNASAPLAAPTGVTATNDREDGVLVSWQGVADATSYELWKGASGAPDPSSLVGTGVETRRLDPNAESGILSRYWVRALGPSSSSALSMPVEGCRPKIVNVTFNGNNGTPSSPSMPYIVGNVYGTLPTAIRTGYNFAGWFTAVTGGSEVTPTTLVDESETVLYAHWDANTYTVTLDSQGGLGGTANVTVTYASAMPSITIPTRSGYTFGGYYSGINGSGAQYYTASGASAQAWDRTGATTLYAHWTLYLVIDLSGGASASSYPVSFMSSVPSGNGFNTDEYKTTKLVLRQIAPGKIPTHDVTVTKSYYIGVFEVTQRQYELVMGTKPSYFSNASYYATRPVEQVSYDMIRGTSSGAGWPGSSEVDSTSFIGRLRSKTGIYGFDLPTEAQWEYACRAGTTTDYNNGKNNTGISCANMAEVGRYFYNGGENWYNGGENYNQICDTSAGTAKVGSYQPNAWGLYDMHGNVWEWCLDWYDSSFSGIDPVGSSSGMTRVFRGGSFGYEADNCTSSRRTHYYPSYCDGSIGFRLVRTLSN